MENKDKLTTATDLVKQILVLELQGLKGKLQQDIINLNECYQASNLNLLVYKIQAYEEIVSKIDNRIKELETIEPEPQKEVTD